jgi:hypothetical protein
MYSPYAITIISKMHHEEILREAEANRMAAIYGTNFDGPTVRLLAATGRAIAGAFEWAVGAFSKKSAPAEANATC